MTRALPFTAAGVKRRIRAAEAAGLAVREIRPDGTIVVEKPDSAVPAFPIGLQSDAYVIAAAGVRDAEKTRKRRGRAS